MGNIVNYQPNPEVTNKLHQVTLVMVVGPSGAGKTTLIEAALKKDPSLHMVVSDTTRPPRPEDRDGADYHFRDQEYMLHRIARREYVQVAPSITGDLYATHPESYASTGIAIIAVLADAVPIFRALSFKTLRTIYIVPKSYEVWRKRMDIHDFTPDQMTKRLAEARRSFKFALNDHDVTLVINDSLEAATNDLLHLALGKPLTSRLQAEQLKARELIAQILAQLPNQ